MFKIRAIVFDSNVFGKSAQPNVKTIEQWAEACGWHDAELWISEIVVHELAQHAIEEHDRFILTYEAHQRNLAKWGVDAGEPMLPIDPHDVREAIEAAGAVVVPLEDSDARDALLDQVLLRGPGQRKSGVKTGAADSAWVRSIVAYSVGDTDGLIVVTGDTHALEQTCADLDVDVPRQAKNLGELRHLLDESEDASEPMASFFGSWVQNHFVNSSHGRSSGIRGEDLDSLADVGYSNWWDLPELPYDGYETWAEQEHSISTVRSAQIVGNVEHDRWSDSLSACIELEVEVEEQYARQDSHGQQVEYASRSFPGRVRGTLQAFVDGDTIEFDGLLEDVEFMSVEDFEVEWQSI
ncbi:hypothetical protein PWY87_17520 [Kribbella solani]|uniref:hypothetical protein n=1 Tax=Kribbella solani TaxID=236067 RepID=UPI0029A8834B|nr:hypothetical protein [Kribbella solani]MDX3003490.1 hypothetical protein [Kribbella solani]